MPFMWQQEETINHLLNLCSYTSTLWNWVADVFNQTERNENDITITLKNWKRDFSDNETMNTTWALIPGFLAWNVWKEHNNRIFKDKTGLAQNIITVILK